jgi:hypothetical protein
MRPPEKYRFRLHEQKGVAPMWQKAHEQNYETALMDARGRSERIMRRTTPVIRDICPRPFEHRRAAVRLQYHFVVRIDDDVHTGLG